jgi:hypothetical protein
MTNRRGFLRDVIDDISARRLYLLYFRSLSKSRKEKNPMLYSIPLLKVKKEKRE